MGIPRFYRWLKDRYPNIRFDLTDTNKQKPIFDNFYIDFNALVYQCIRQSGCFLKNKVKPLTFDQICQRVIDYLLELVRQVNPRKLLFIAFDGVAPRAKINQSRDRRFRSGIEDIKFFEDLMQKVGIQTKQIFESNSISPGTQFLFNLCSNLKAKIMELMESQWKGLHVFYSDCCVPGQGEHKIMDFLRYTKQIELFNKNTTHCVYSPDADVILLTLTLNLDYICIIKEDTSVLPSMNWTATSTYRKVGSPQFELVMINIVREYLEREFEQELRDVKNCTIQKIINDFVVLMAFVGNDFLPVQFCFVLKDNHMDQLFNSYKQYLKQHQSFINNEGVIDWQNVSHLLKVAKKFEANRINQMKTQRRMKKQTVKQQETVFDAVQKQKQADDRQSSQIQQFQVQDSNIVNGVGYYYQSRFNIQDRKNNTKFEQIIKKYIEGLQFYCQYYYKGLPSWTWYYPFHYTPLLCDVYEYLTQHKIDVQLVKNQPFDPVLALMFMLPEQNFGLLPKIVKQTLMSQKCILRKPFDFYPLEFTLDKFETLKYNKRAIIQFLNEEDVRKVYNQIPKEKFTKEQLTRNSRNSTILLFQQKEKINGISCVFNQKFNEEIKRVIRYKYDGKKKDNNQRRFPTLTIFGQKFKLNQKGKIASEQKYKYQGNPSELVFFNNFIGYVEKCEKADPSIRDDIESQYEKKAGISGTCSNYFIVKRGQYVRQLGRHHVATTRKEVIVPDFALFKAPNYDYVHKTQTFEPKQLYQLKERVIILSGKYFGCSGTIEQLGDKTLKVKLSDDPLKSQSKIEQLQDEFYTVQYVLNELEISKETLFSIISQIIVLPIMKKKNDFNERIPTALNFGLNFIDINNLRLVPRFVRCNFSFQNPRNPIQIFQNLQFSETAVKLLKNYVELFHWLVEQMQETKSYKSRREFKVGSLFGGQKDPNIKAYREFIKLYELDAKGFFTSIYTKSSDLNNLPKLYTEKKGENAIVTFNYWEVISRNLGLQAPPAYSKQPEYHDIGSRVIFLKSLQVGYVICIDNHWIHVILGKEKRRAKIRFTDLYNESWEHYLMKDVGSVWNLEVSYYTPTYWKKVTSTNK